MSDMTELMLYVAARAQLVDEVIKPALDKNQVVISDRFVDSSAVYQGIARGLGTKLVYEMNQYAISRMPDITFLLDLDAKEGIKRKKHQAALDRLELEKLSFHEKVVEGYRSLAQEQDRIVLIDATLPKETIFERIISVLQERKIMK